MRKFAIDEFAGFIYDRSNSMCGIEIDEACVAQANLAAELLDALKRIAEPHNSEHIYQANCDACHRMDIAQAAIAKATARGGARP